MSAKWLWIIVGAGIVVFFAAAWLGALTRQG